MKTTVIVTAMILATISAWADIVITPTNQIPPSLLVENSIVPMVKFLIMGNHSDISAFTIGKEGTAHGSSLGKLSITATLQDGQPRGPSILSQTSLYFGDGKDVFRIPIVLGFTGERTYLVEIKLEMASDLGLNTGQTLGFSLVTIETAQSVSGNLPIIVGSTHTVNATLAIGSLAVNSAGQDQNLTIGSPNQTLGAFAVNVSNTEAMEVNWFKFCLETPGQNASLVSNVVLVDGSGNIVAGPVDLSGISESGEIGWIVFADTVVFPKGSSTYFLKGKPGVGLQPNGLLRIYTVPEEWQVRGQIYGYETKARPFETVFGPTMTLKGPALRISFDSNFLPNTVVSGMAQVIVAKVVLDASESSEDIRLSSIPLELSLSDTSPADLTRGTLYDGITPINSGYNILNPTDTGLNNLVFDSTMTLSKGTTKTLALGFDLRSKGLSSPVGKIRWSITESNRVMAVGIVSANAALVTILPSERITTVLPAVGARMNRLEVAQIEGFPVGWRTATIAFSGDPQLIYTVEESTDLVSWQTVSAYQTTFKPDWEGTFTVVAYLDSGEKYKFYRAVGRP